MTDPRRALIIQEYRLARERLLAAHPELADDEDAFRDTLDGETEAIDAIADLIRDAREDDALADALDTIIKANRERKARLEARADSRRKAALDLMQVLGERRIERPDFTASIKASRQSVIVMDEDAVPAAFCRITRAPDKTAIRDAIERGENVPGAVLSNGGESLSVRVR